MKLEFSNLDVDILQISKEAKKAKSNDPNVINATLGVLLDENGQLLEFKAVKEALLDIDMVIAKNYLPQDGGALYKNSLQQYLFKSKVDEVLDKYHLASTWTSGGSGALYMAFKYDGAKRILLPNIRWNEYDQIVGAVNKEIGTYNLLKNGAFDLESLKTEMINQDESVLVVINDPCQNPTGYVMSLAEHEALAKLINEQSTTKKISLLLDVAYLDYSSEPYFEFLLPILEIYHSNVDIYIAFSGSKSFGIYGFRMGALLYLNENETKVTLFEQKIKRFAGAIYGAPNSISVQLLNEVIHKASLEDEQEQARHLINSRANKFMGLCLEEKINFYTYINGFFVTVKTKEPLKLTEALKQYKVYVVPTFEGVRIALSSINLLEIERLVTSLKKVIDE